VPANVGGPHERARAQVGGVGLLRDPHPFADQPLGKRSAAPPYHHAGTSGAPADLGREVPGVRLGDVGQRERLVEPVVLEHHVRVGCREARA